MFGPFGNWYIRVDNYLVQQGSVNKYVLTMKLEQPILSQEGEYALDSNFSCVKFQVLEVSQVVLLDTTIFIYLCFLKNIPDIVHHFCAFYQRQAVSFFLLEAFWQMNIRSERKNLIKTSLEYVLLLCKSDSYFWVQRRYKVFL